MLQGNILHNFFTHMVTQEFFHSLALDEVTLTIER
jgi:hypothetical protein